MILNDQQIKAYAAQGMIEPFYPELVRTVEDRRVLSYGLCSFGYDLRLSSKEFMIFRHVPGKVVDPKNFMPASLESEALHHDENGDYFILPGRSYGLGVAVERLRIPRNVSALCVGKSTYARCGIIANVTPAEAGWEGHLTLEFSNSSAADCRIYANEGVVQMVFFQGDECSVCYDHRTGKYQHQSEQITLPKA
jgi:dCTP deaminase